MLKRRDFLRATLITAGALMVPGCSSDPEQPTPDRRLTDGEAFFPQSVASGDPKPGSVILWTRLEDSARASEDLDVLLEVSEDKSFATVLDLPADKGKLQAQAKYDHCVKVKLAGLAAGTTYYYRFIYEKDGKSYVSHTGRTKTAPDEGADVPVRFAYVSCQDYIGRYYNSYIPLAEEDVDFVVHLGDYIYETTGDPSFQDTSGRAVKFTDEAGAIAFQTPDGTYYAAKSLDNYRELYKSYRSDKNLQRVHELFPMIVVWDDHEYSNDCHGAVAAYFNGEQDETDEARRKNANQAWFEYQPVDYAAGDDFTYDPAAAYPNDLRIYRDFVFGKHLHLVMTDLRTFRADHLIPEEAFPGAVVFDQAALTAGLGMVPDEAAPYVDIDTYQNGAYKQVLVAAADSGGYTAADVKGNVSVAFINAVVSAVPNSPVPPIDPMQASLERGLAYIDMGKASAHTSIGSRYFVVKDAFDIYAKLLYQKDKKNEEVLGAEQEAWFLSTLEGSNATWKVWGNEYALNQLAIDLSKAGLPAAFARRFYMNCDTWDGFRNKRSELLAKLSSIGNVVAVTGDIHAFYAGTPMVEGDPSKKIVEFVGSSVSSTTFKSELIKQVETDPVLSKVAGATILAAQIDELLTSSDSKVNPQLGYAASAANGYAVAEVSGGEFGVTMVLIGENDVSIDYSDKTSDLMARVKRVKFQAKAGESELYQEIGGSWKRWDSTSLSWV